MGRIFLHQKIQQNAALLRLQIAVLVGLFKRSVRQIIDVAFVGDMCLNLGDCVGARINVHFAVERSIIRIFGLKTYQIRLPLLADDTIQQKIAVKGVAVGRQRGQKRVLQQVDMVVVKIDVRLHSFQQNIVLRSG